MAGVFQRVPGVGRVSIGPVNCVDDDAGMATSPILASFRKKEIEQLERLEQRAKISGLRRSSAVEHGAASPEQQRCFCTVCKLATASFLQPAQTRWNNASPEQALPGTILWWWPTPVSLLGDRYLFLFFGSPVPHFLIEPQLLRTFPAQPVHHLA
jgi:hypothetical protein